MEEIGKPQELDFKQIISEWKESGRTIRDFCESKGIREPQFYYHKQKIESGKPGRKIPVIRLGVPVRESSHQGYEISRAGVTIRIPAKFDPAQVKSLLELLGK